MTTPPTETDAEREFRMRAAERAHDEASRELNAMFGTVISFGSDAIKSAAVVNGGSAAAMLAFIGTGRQPVTLDTILALRYFGSGLLGATIATGCAYFAQFFYQYAAMARLNSWHYPYIQGTKKGRILERFGIGFHVVAALLVIGAYVCAVTGLMKIAGSLVAMPAKG